MENCVKIASDYTRTPGGRYIKEGDFSGEDFRKKILKPAFLKAVSENVTLIVDLDGGFGYAPSFLEEAFGGLVRELADPKILDIIIISNEEPQLVEDVHNYIKNALGNIK